MSVVWRPVPGYEGRYEVSSMGEIRSLGFWVRAKGGALAFRKGRVLNAAIKSNGYAQVTLISEGGNRVSAQVHQIVALAFLGEPFNGAQVCHGNGNRVDNRLENLRYGTASENAQDRFLHGTFRCNLPQLAWYEALQ